jgi:hypothetical protein
MSRVAESTQGGLAELCPATVAWLSQRIDPLRLACLFAFGHASREAWPLHSRTPAPPGIFRIGAPDPLFGEHAALSLAASSRPEVVS